MQNPVDRRRFLYTSGLTLGGLLAGSACARGAGGAAAGDTAGSVGASGAAGTAGTTATGGGTAAATPPLASQIGIQLYTVRDRMEGDMPGTLKTLADIGYRELEFAGYYQYEENPKALRALLDGYGLTAPSTHAPLDQLRSSLPQVLSTADVLGHEYVVCPFSVPGGTVEEFRRLAAELDKIGAACREGGRRFAYHNHAFEFKPAAGGTTFYDVLLAETDPDNVALEADLFWMTKASKDPVTMFEQHRGRFPLWHVKDMSDIKGAQTMAPVGEGEIDYRRLFAQAPAAGLTHFFVEHDSAAEWPGGALASVRTSYANLKQLLS